VFIQGQGLVLGQDSDLSDAGINAVREREVDDPVNSAKGDRGLRSMDSEGMEPFSLASGKYHCQNAHGMRISPCIQWTT
jgi:hypothetical protein